MKLKICIKCELNKKLWDFPETTTPENKRLVLDVCKQCSGFLEKGCVACKALFYASSKQVLCRPCKRTNYMKSDGKICLCCGIHRAAELFYKNCDAKDGTTTNCSVCLNEKQKQMLAGSKKLRIIKVIRNRTTRAIKSALEGRSTQSRCFDYFGCNKDLLKYHIESQFQPGMTWDNWEFKGWHIDHIKALSSFDLENKEELKKAVHYTNLQPLWAEQNMKKGVK